MKSLRLFLISALWLIAIGANADYMVNQQFTRLANEESVVEPLFADGTYYIYNIGAEKFLAAGANWGTHAVVNDAGLDYIITFVDGKYTLDSQVSNGGNNHFLNGEWNDGAAFGWIFTEVADRVFTLSNGDKFLAAGEDGIVTLVDDSTIPAAQWKLKALADRLVELATATANAPVDATFLIADADFGRNDLRRSAWTMVANNFNLSGGNNVNNCAESYHSAFTLSQTLSNVLPGKYLMTAQGFYRQDAGDNDEAPVFYANETTIPFPVKTGSENSMSNASESFTAGQYVISPIEVYVGNDGQLTIGAKATSANQWVIFDNFRLVYYGNDFDANYYKLKYEEALAAANVLLEDEESAVVTGIEYEMLKEVIGQYSQVEDTQEAYEAAIAALTEAVATFKDAKNAYQNLEDVRSEMSIYTYRYEYASADKKAAAESVIEENAQSADEAMLLAERMIKIHRELAESHAMLESVEGAVDVTSKIVNPNAEQDIADPWMVLNGENSNGRLTILSNESPIDANANTYNYFDGGDWSANAWDVTMAQMVYLNAGKYLLTASGRASAEVELTVFAGDDTAGFPSLGAQGGLYGRGWNDASVEFELDMPTYMMIGVHGVTESIHNWMSFTRFRLVKFEADDDMPIIEPEEDENDFTSYIKNAGFDEDLTWQADGSKKEIVDTVTLSNRSLAGIAADSSLYTIVNPETSKSRPDGRTFEATNGFIGQVDGWTLETNQQFPKCEWVYFGTIPYALGETTIPVADDGNSYLTVPAKPAEFDTDDNTGFAYMRSGWGGRAVYKQVVELPCAEYRLEYWTININPSATKGKNLSKVICRNDVFTDEVGFNDQEWTKHTIEFTPTSEFTIEFGFESEGGSGGNPFLCIDGIKLYKIGEADPIDILTSDLLAIREELEALEAQFYEKELVEIGNNISMYVAYIDNVISNKDQSEMEQAFEQAKLNLQDWNELLAACEELAELKEEAALYDFSYASEEKIKWVNELLEIVPQSSEDAMWLTEELTMALRQVVESHAMLEGVEGAVDVTSKIVNPNADEAINDPWMLVNGENSRSQLRIMGNEPLTDGDGNDDYRYFDGGYYGDEYWDTSLLQPVTLNPGRYMLTVSGRASADVALTVVAGEYSNGIPSLGNAGGLFGRGWNDASVVFELETPTTVVLGVNGVATAIHSWMSFTRFRLVKFEADEAQFMLGDVNQDQEVTISDAVATVSFVLEETVPTTEQFMAADVNYSNSITVSDVVGIVRMALDNESLHWELLARSENAGANFLTQQGTELSLMNSTPFVAFQMDVTLDNGAVLNGVRLSDRAAGLKVRYNRLEGNTYRVVAYSMSDAEIQGCEGSLCKFDIVGSQTVKVENIEFTDAQARAYAIGLTETTDINGVKAGTADADYYTIDGVKSSQMRKGMNVVRKADGQVKKMFVK